jgi:hypothetical protein
MSKKTVNVDLYVRQADKMVGLGKRISEKNVELGENSPLKGSKKLDALQIAVSSVEAKRKEAIQLRKTSEKLMQESENLLGYAEGQTAETPGTVYNLLTSIRNILLEEYRGNEETLKEWGFDVVVGTAKNPVRKKE